MFLADERHHNNFAAKMKRFEHINRERFVMKHDPGGKVSINLPIWIRSEAAFGGPGDCYRYRLSRTWDDTLPVLFFLLLNPSTAGHATDDPTVAKCRRYAEAWGFGTLFVGNTFAYRATDQKRLREVVDPVGPDNDRHLSEMADLADMIVCAYGKPHKSLQWRGHEVASRLCNGGKRKLHVLKLSAGNVPAHPLYLKGNLRPVEWIP